MNWRTIVSLTLVVGTLYSCTEYRKVLKSQDMQWKYDMALEYMKSEKFTKAYPLLDELYIMYRGTEKGEKIAYKLASCEFGMKDYILAGHRYGQFFKNYPGSDKRERAQFMSAFCNYKVSPKPSLDQTETYKAVRSFQLFAIQHPESPLIDSCNLLLDELRYKIELKEYRASKLYYKRETYRAATVSLKNFNDRYPNSRYKEETWFLWFKSSYLLAKNSVTEKKVERIESAIKAYTTFADRFPESKYMKEAVSLDQDLNKTLELELNQT
ncbi:outer membrane protein assembly factor BamD [Salibacteraceae bacterium]|nr:outer membrane protein assembly factor BamD [Flavobacteriales bacterium]MDB9701768.1 outer membrane protein assembly factor BamD [Salibacteraceae bacterium]